ncbi:PA3496 family putative envelope integrity protein [Litchfieldella rifensis]|uniref:PA3496 family putative envelope integrity protein n=1 Tax=Litchfieldella rifensis TaxID=762643 RepID=A0ABV7LR96_9GAMM
MSREHLVNDPQDDEQEFFDAVNDEHYTRSRPSSRADTLRARRRVEALLEERRLKRAIEDDWSLDLDDEEEE